MQRLDQMKNRLSEQTAWWQVLKKFEYWVEMATIAEWKSNKKIWKNKKISKEIKELSNYK